MVIFVSCTQEELTELPASKTKALLVYMVADNDLDFYATANINEMEEFFAQSPDMGVGVCLY